jgi:S-adenosylmethionine synthetase
VTRQELETFALAELKNSAEQLRITIRRNRFIAPKKDTTASIKQGGKFVPGGPDATGGLHGEPAMGVKP